VSRFVSVKSPARLHLGFLDLNAEIGRKFGSIGLAINSHYTQLSVASAEQLSIVGPALSIEAEQRIKSLLDRFYQTLGSSIPQTQRAVEINLSKRIAEHAGLGSGTQLALTLGRALSHYHKLTITTPDIASHLGRGKRSGVGIATFDHGGFIVDGGLKAEQSVPPILMQSAFPQPWRIVLIMDNAHQGVHGSTEKQAFKTLPTFPKFNSQAICHLTLMQLLPALKEEDIDAFGLAITKIQALIGDHFAAAQGGGRYTSAAVASCLEFAQKQGHRGIAQSSWGPTGCVFVDGDDNAEALLSALQQHAYQHIAKAETLSFITVQADNNGAIIETSV